MCLKAYQDNQQPNEHHEEEIKHNYFSHHENTKGHKLHHFTGEYSPGNAYRNIKTHKPSNPLRSIISRIPTATYTTGKTLNELTLYVPSTYSFTSSSDFEILHFTHIEDSIIAYFDLRAFSPTSLLTLHTYRGLHRCVSRLREPFRQHPCWQYNRNDTKTCVALPRHYRP